MTKGHILRMLAIYEILASGLKITRSVCIYPSFPVKRPWTPKPSEGKDHINSHNSPCGQALSSPCRCTWCAHHSVGIAVLNHLSVPEILCWLN